MSKQGTVMKKVLGVLVICALGACTTAHKINNVALGMTKSEVISAIGAPSSSSAAGKTEYLKYRLYESYAHAANHVGTPFFVRLIDGKVDSYGKVGDFDSTQTPTIRVETDENITIK